MPLVQFFHWNTYIIRKLPSIWWICANFSDTISYYYYSIRTAQKRKICFAIRSRHAICWDSVRFNNEIWNGHTFRCQCMRYVEDFYSLWCFFQIFISFDCVKHIMRLQISFSVLRECFTLNSTAFEFDWKAYVLLLSSSNMNMFTNIFFFNDLHFVPILSLASHWKITTMELNRNRQMSMFASFGQ